MTTNNYSESAAIYSEHDETKGTLSVAYKALNRIMRELALNGRLALDYGCGAGRSTRFLRSLGLTAYGVDICSFMLQEAIAIDKQLLDSYALIEDGQIKHRNSKFDLVFSSLVVLEIPTKKDLRKYFEEAARVIKFNGHIVVVTVNDDFYNYDWMSVDTSEVCSKKLNSGDKLKIKLKEIGLELYDYYWNSEDYIEIAREAGLYLHEKYTPLAQDDSEDWISEDKYPPFGIYIFKKELSKKEQLFEKYPVDIKLENRGVFRELCRGRKQIIRNRKRDGLSVSRQEFSKIRLIMEKGNLWPFHELGSDETLTYIDGSDIYIHLIYGGGKYERVILGIEDSAAVQSITIPEGTVFAEELVENGKYSVIEGKTRPAFDVDDVIEYSYEQAKELVNDSSSKLFDILSINFKEG